MNNYVKGDTILDCVPLMKSEEFLQLSNTVLYKFSRNIVKRHLENSFAKITVPVHLLIIRNGHSDKENGGIRLGHCTGLYSGVDDGLVNKIMFRCGMPTLNKGNVNDLIEKYNKIVDDRKYTSSDEKCKLRGVVLRIFFDDVTNNINNFYEEVDDYLPTYFFGVIVHLTTYAVQICACDMEKSLREAKDLEAMRSVTEADIKNDEIRKKEILNNLKYKNLFGNKRIETIRNIHHKFAYRLTLSEKEAAKEEYWFIMSVVNSSCADKEIINKIEENLKENDIG